MNKHELIDNLKYLLADVPDDADIVIKRVGTEKVIYDLITDCGYDKKEDKYYLF